VIGTHPIPLKYMEAYEKLTFWKAMKMEELAWDLMREERDVMESYN
jgi:hypothetical protein